MLEMLSPTFLLLSIGGSAVILGGALALGIRHGVDWDHIAAITDITSTTAAVPVAERVPSEELAMALSRAGASWEFERATVGASHANLSGTRLPKARTVPFDTLGNFARQHRMPLFLGSMYAFGHGSMVVVLGLMAILFKEVLPDWIDPIMERMVGLTLLILAGYLFYSVFSYFRGGDFRLRSRWMLVFAGIGRGWHWTISRVTGRAHDHAQVRATDQQYGTRTAYGIGLIHGIGAETGTQVLIIGTAVGAGSTGMSVATLLAFVVGLLISNSMVTIASTTGFVSAQRRQIVYVAVGIVAAIFSLVVGLVFLAQSAELLPNPDPYLRWIGGPG